MTVTGQLIARRPKRSVRRHVDGWLPPSPTEDPELHIVAQYLRSVDPGGSRMANVLRSTIDQLLDGQHTGRWDWQTLRKTEKTHMGTLVEINLHREFDFADGDATDYRIQGIEVDCKFSQAMGGWELPPESLGHLCLLVWANDDLSRWEAGLVRVSEDKLRGSGNRDGKRRLSDAGESCVLWLHENPELPINLYATLMRKCASESLPLAALATAARRASTSSFVRFNTRSCDERSCSPWRSRTTPLSELGTPGCRNTLGTKGSSCWGIRNRIRGRASARPSSANQGRIRQRACFVPVAGQRAAAAEINGAYWRLAKDGDPVVAAPQLVRAARRS